MIGSPSDLIKRLTDQALTSLALLFENARPGRSAPDVARAVTQALKPRIESFGLQSRFQARADFIGYGYTVGISFPPDWVEHSLFIDERHDRLLEEGMVFHTPMAAKIPGEVGISISETMAITATGCEALSKLPHELTVVAV